MKTLLDKPAVPPRRAGSLNGGSVYEVECGKRRAWGLSQNGVRNQAGADLYVRACLYDARVIL